ERPTFERSSFDPDARSLDGRALVSVDDATRPALFVSPGGAHDFDPSLAFTRLRLGARRDGLGLVLLGRHAPEEEEREHGDAGEEDRRFRDEARFADGYADRVLTVRLVPRRRWHVAEPHECLAALRCEREHEACDAALDRCRADDDIADTRFDRSFRDRT